MNAEMWGVVDTGLRRQRWADFSDDDTESSEWGLNAEQVSVPAPSITLASGGRRCWADMVSDDEECLSPCSTMAPPSEFDEVRGFVLRSEDADSDRKKEEDRAVAAVAKVRDHEHADLLEPSNDWSATREKKREAKKEATGRSKLKFGSRQSWWELAGLKASSSTAVPSRSIVPPQGTSGKKQSQTHKWAYPAPSRAAPSRAPRGYAKRRGQTQCQFYIGIQEEPDFSVVQRVLGLHGSNMKRIALNTGSRLRLRGLGSGFLEGPTQKESTDALMLCVSAPDTEAYLKTKQLVTELLEDVYHQYRTHCQRRRVVPEDVKIHVHEGFRGGSR